MWLVLDIGNSAAKGGFVEGGDLRHPFRFDLTRTAPSSDWKAALQRQLDGRDITRAGLVSVVPDATEAVCQYLHELTGVEPDVVHHEMTLPFTLAYETPHTLGMDRLAAAAAAWVKYGIAADGPSRSVVAVDVGTAVTYEVIDRTGVFRGGVIGASPQLLRDALHQGTAQLPRVPLTVPDGPIGRSTQEALQSGIMAGFVDSVRGMVERIGEVLDDRPVVVATGGWSSFLQQHLDVVNYVEPHLVLHGIRVLLDLNEAR